MFEGKKQKKTKKLECTRQQRGKQKREVETKAPV